MTLAKEEKPMPTKRTTKRTAAIAETTPMTVADALEAGRRAYEAADGSTGTAMQLNHGARPPRCKRGMASRRAGILIGRADAWINLGRTHTELRLLDASSSRRIRPSG